MTNNKQICSTLISNYASMNVHIWLRLHVGPPRRRHELVHALQQAFAGCPLSCVLLGPCAVRRPHQIVLNLRAKKTTATVTDVIFK